MAGLTKKQMVFVSEYLRSWNGAAAARASGTPHKSAYQVAYENLRKPEIRDAIEARLKEKAMSADEVLARLADQARATLYPFIRVVDSAVEFDFSHPEAMAHLYLIKKIHTKRKRLIALGTGTKNKAPDEWEHEWVEVELYDAQAALVQLGKHHKLFAEQLDITSGGEKIKGYIGIDPAEWDKRKKNAD